MSDTHNPEPKRFDFHGRTCGECAWAVDDGGTSFHLCRRTGACETEELTGWCAVRPSWPACPAFVAKGDE